MVAYWLQHCTKGVGLKDAYDILLVEDSPSQALQFQLVLQRAGFLVRVVIDGAEGWRVACEDLPKLILLDIDLPTLDGFQILGRLKRDRITTHIPVLMLTNREHISNVERALSLGVDNYLFKDDAAEQLCAAVMQMLDTRESTTL
jgi:DNA-binding response OmpR family regulator